LQIRKLQLGERDAEDMAMKIMDDYEELEQ
jgi:hypothetical protein